MSKKYYIQILDGETNQIVYFDRMKTYRSTHRVITSSLSGKCYLSRQVAELEVELIRQYYHGELIIEIVERKFTEQKSDEDFIF
jgi:hypothetical protein